MGSLRGAGTSLALLVLVLGGSARGDEPAGGVFVLPVSRAWPVNESAAALFEERVGIALADARRARALSARDIPEKRRRDFPVDLATCVAPACLLERVRTLALLPANDQTESQMAAAIESFISEALQINVKG